ncbi:hypothetical protein ABPG74_008060 [Tetrahymena malaccensis]
MEVNDKKDFDNLKDFVKSELSFHTDLEFDLSQNLNSKKDQLNLCLALSKCSNLKSLSLFLTDNKIGPQGEKDFFMGLSKCENISILNITRKYDIVYPYLRSKILKMNKLVEFSIEQY